MRFVAPLAMVAAVVAALSLALWGGLLPEKPAVRGGEPYAPPPTVSLPLDGSSLDEEDPAPSTPQTGATGTSGATTTSGSPPSTAGNTTYVVKQGDTPVSIASELGISVELLLEHNGIEDPRSLDIGEVLEIPRETGNGSETR